MSPADHFLTFCVRHFAPCRRDTLTDAELLSIVENHPALHDLTHPRADAGTTERQPSPRDDDQNIDWKARAEYLEASLSTLKSRIDVEGMARVISRHTPWNARDAAQALRTLILGEEGNSSSVDSRAPGYMARSDTPSQTGWRKTDPHLAAWHTEAAKTRESGRDPCEGCGKPGVVVDVNGCDLCQHCADGCGI